METKELLEEAVRCSGPDKAMNRYNCIVQAIAALNRGEGRPALSHIVIPCDTISCNDCCGVLEVTEKAGQLKCNECGRMYFVGLQADGEFVKELRDKYTSAHESVNFCPPHEVCVKDIFKCLTEINRLEEEVRNISGRNIQLELEAEALQAGVDRLKEKKSEKFDADKYKKLGGQKGIDKRY